ncbi:MAG TPA: aminotransferase class V-fold PLP-dependent enzyme [Candidatus Polarisedimenticolaceae bacterium]|nr:aminotransferase class V-fold PLP-dependent enzyme [Candidatus Polarisedimenticolaceae bacterium]
MEPASDWPLDPTIHFLNHGSFGSCPTPVLRYQSELRRRMERQPVQFFVRDLEALLDGAREALARFVHVAADDLVPLSNATAGVNAVLRSLDLGATDELLVTDHEYNACRNALDYVASRAGARVVVAAIPFPLTSPDEVVEAVLGRVTRRTRLALLDHVTSQTGLVLPIERLVAELASRGVETLVDGAHAPGMLDLDLSRVGAAYYAGNCHKWLCAPKGAGFLYARRDLQPAVRPIAISHGANTPRPGRSRFQTEFGWLGTDDPTPFLCVPRSLRFLADALPGGWPALRRRNRGLVLEGRRVLCEALDRGLPCPDEMIGSLASIPLPAAPPAEGRSALYGDPLQEVLLGRFSIEVPIVAWPAAPERLVRISAQLYNRPEQYRLLAAALGEVLRA